MTHARNAARVASKNSRPKQRKPRPREPAVTLRFTPYAWAKLLFLRDYGDTEVGGFGITSDKDLLLIEDVQLVQQHCSFAHVAFVDESVADFFDRQIDAGRRPEQFARHWLHTHPGDCPLPSWMDEDTFIQAFGRSDWASMFILAKEGETYARLRFNVGPGAALEIPVVTDFGQSFEGSDEDAWEAEYLQNVLVDPTEFGRGLVSRNLLDSGGSGAEQADWSDWLDEWAEYTAPYSDDVQEQQSA